MKDTAKVKRARYKRIEKPTVTHKQKRLAELVVENRRHDNKPKPMGELVREAGYSEATVIKPSEITESKGFRQAMIDIGADESKLASVFNSGLDANRVDIIKGELVASDIPDVPLRVKTAEIVAKLMGYAPQSTPSGNTYNTVIQNNLDPNTTNSQDIVNNTLDMLMNQTKRD